MISFPYIIENVFLPLFDACFVEPSLEPFVQAVSSIYKVEDPVEAYRNYYRFEKKHILKYTNRTPPYWL